jgi:hypothetical protein
MPTSAISRPASPTIRRHHVRAAGDTSDWPESTPRAK